MLPFVTCQEASTFCAFYRPLKGKLASEGYILDFDTIYQKIAETEEMGGTGVLMQGGIHPDLKIDWFEALFSGIKQRFPKIWLHCLSASEILAIAEYSEIDLRTTIARLRDAGLDSIPGGGAEILDDEVRKRIARLKCRTEDWVSVHRTAHELGMRTTATMMFGVGETMEQRVNHFEVVRRLQEETGGFTAFIPWSFQPNHTALGGRGWEEATSVEYLKTLAISRMFLDNIENVQSSWVTQGLKVLQMGLRFGGNDVGSVMLEENVVKAAGDNAFLSLIIFTLVFAFAVGRTEPELASWLRQILARNLADAARGYRIRTRSPSTHLVLPRMVEGEDAKVDLVLSTCRRLGVTVLCGNSCKWQKPLWRAHPTCRTVGAPPSPRGQSSHGITPKPG